MRTITLYRHGATMGTPSSSPNKTPPKRGEVQGWSESATRRNIAFLRSIDEHAIQADEDGQELVAIALTLTIKDCPQSSDDWHKLRRSFIKRLERLGLVRSHWVTEWQRRGVPHLHGAFWFPDTHNSYDYSKLFNSIINHWLEAASAYNPKPISQHLNPIYDSVGWFKYLAKHAARGVRHYQRSVDNVPEAWKKTGRVWGHTGQWPLIEPDKRIITEKEYFRLRRLARTWRKADARQSTNRYRIKSARRMLKHNHPEQSKLRGISEWIPQATMLALLDYVRSQGENNEH